LTQLRLNIGASHTYLPGYTNIDLVEHADISLDLSSQPLPFEDNSVDLIFSYQTLEHIPDHLFALREMYRVLRHDAPLLLSLPYVTSTEFHLVNPYHLHNYSEHSFGFFDPDIRRGSAGEKGTPIFKQVLCRYRYMRGWRHLPEPLRTWSRRHLYNVVRVFDVGLIAVKDPDRGIDAGPGREAQLGAEFDNCMAQLVRYGKRPGDRPAVAAEAPEDGAITAGSKPD
jgi:SAM-dependent methyltransferase